MEYQKPRSTTALTAEQHAAQDARFAEGHEYDYVIVGTGNSALTAASLLTNAGHTVCMLEAHDIPGGYAQNFKRGDFVFNGQVHYIWGAGPGGKIYEFLKKIGLHEDITFELYNPDGYDIMRMPDGKKVAFPYGWDELIANVSAAYPEQSEQITKFVKIMERIRTELHESPDRGTSVWGYLKKAHKFPTIFRYRNKTLQDVFDECELSIETQSVFSANMGDYMAPPYALSFMMYIALLAGYNTGAYYPTKHYKYYVERLVQFIESHDGCHIYYETPVNKVNIESREVKSVTTQNGKTFTAKKGFIWNGDPQRAAKEIIGMENFSRSYQKKLNYEYSTSGIMIYLGIKDLDLTQYGFGKHNIWHLEDWDMNKQYDKQFAGDFTNPWWFMSTPTLHSDAPGTTPEGMHIMEIATSADYQSFADLAKKDKREYMRRKNEIVEQLIDLIQERYNIPDFRKHIAMKVTGTSTTNEEFVHTPFGNAYGSAMIPSQIGLHRLPQKTSLKNFYFCNSSAGYAGVYGTVLSGIQIYMTLTNDIFLKGSQLPSDKELIAAARKRFAEEQGN